MSTPADKVVFGLRPDDIYPTGHGIHSGEAADVHQIELPVTVTEPLGNETLVFAEFDGGDWVSRMLNPKPLRPGEMVDHEPRSVAGASVRRRRPARRLRS